MNNATCAIRLCPVEILQDIFEIFVQSTKPKLRSAILISHICREWRRIALNTPTLWSEIKLHLDSPRSTIGHYWNEVKQRTRHAPLDISIFLDGESFQSALPSTFLEATSIDTLRFKFPYHRHADLQSCFRELIEGDFSIPPSPIRHLELFYVHKAYIEPPWNLDVWLSRWTSVEELKIYTSSEFLMTRKMTFPNVKIFELHSVKSIDFRDVIESFPNLQSLVFITYTSSQHRRTTPRLMPQLENLSANTDTEQIWDGIICPKLITLNIRQMEYSQHLYRFLESHRFLQRLELDWQDSKQLRKFSTYIPQVKVLQVGMSNENDKGLDAFYDWNGSDDSKPAFPNLEQLILRDRGFRITKEQFELLVTTRFLSVEHPESRPHPDINHPIRLLTVIFNRSQKAKVKEEPQWRSSRLLDSVKEIQKIHEDYEFTYEMRWID